MSGAIALFACGTNDDPPDSAAGSVGNGASAGGSAAGRASPAAGSGGSPGTPAAGSGGGTLALANLAGTFTLQFAPAREATPTSDASPAQASFIGKVSDGPTPVAEAWVVDSQAGGCKLSTPKAPFCDPACGSSAVCVSDDNCVQRGTAQTVGKIRLKGVGASEITMMPIANNYQPPAGTTLPYPPCREGDALSLAADGGSYSAFTLETKCIASLDFQGPIALEKGKPLKLSWQVPSQPALTRLQVKLDISHHGGSRGKIDCDVDDNGSLELPATMVDKLLDLGVAGYPTIILTRLASGGVTTGEPMQVAFNVQESVERAVEIAGLVSCAEDSDCTAPMTCQADLTCK